MGAKKVEKLFSNLPDKYTSIIAVHVTRIRLAGEVPPRNAPDKELYDWFFKTFSWEKFLDELSSEEIYEIMGYLPLELDPTSSRQDRIKAIVDLFDEAEKAEDDEPDNV